ncbi:MAG: DUF4128 domain-containing protein [Treponema sp.]|jgi:hypothetical protein|nr:DUF4128 domain-containing protein [Treponema sp.]
MNDGYIQDKLTAVFLSLNDFSGVEYIKRSGEKLLNVDLPNVPFTPPADKRFFSLSFLPNEPDPSGLGTNAGNTWTGVFQIDIMVPIGAGMAEISAKYDWICRLFSRGKTFDEVMILRTYRAAEGPETDFYRTVIRVEFRADLSK